MTSIEHQALRALALDMISTGRNLLDLLEGPRVKGSVGEHLMDVEDPEAIEAWSHIEEVRPGPCEMEP